MRQLRSAAATFLCIQLITCGRFADAIVVRHDVSDSKYRVAGTQTLRGSTQPCSPNLTSPGSSVTREPIFLWINLEDTTGEHSLALKRQSNLLLRMEQQQTISKRLCVC